MPTARAASDLRPGDEVLILTRHELEVLVGCIDLALEFGKRDPDYQRVAPQLQAIRRLLRRSIEDWNHRPLSG
jgi:hypothetical protein